MTTPPHPPRQVGRYEIRYGKAEISLYRTRPAGGPLFGALVQVDVFGDNFLPAYTEGDNSMVVATDTMKNFTYAAALEFEGATHEGFAEFLARRFLETYAHVQRVRIRCRELPFNAWSDKLLSPSYNDHGNVVLDADRSGIVDLECAREDLRLVKLTGSAFVSFLRDRYTTLPEREDRPLYIHLDVRWRYGDPRQALGAEHVPSQEVATSVRATFDEFVSLSIQHLVHEMGERLLKHYPQLSEVSFDAQNRLWDTSAESETDELTRVYSEPKPAHGLIGLKVKR
jgi:urate oxidase / 2-oxo-4-hydroxy-4-carboxy-5-ureidoimidazoline decarboxylase